MADSALIDKSLDEIVKIKGISGRGGRGGFGRGRGGGGGRGRGGAQGGGGGNRGRFNRSFGGSGGRRPNASGGVQKRRSAGGVGLNTSLSPNKAAAASINGQWNHDLYQNGAALNNPAFRRLATGASAGPAKLIISNLDFGVNDSDIEGLFQEFGKIRKAAVHYDRSGRSLGTADVLFERKQDAIRALTHYNGVSLDGRPMNIQLTASLSAAPVAMANGGGQRNGGARRGGPRRSGGGGGGGGGGGRGGFRGGRGGRQPKVVKSAADLDADLDAHNAKMQTD